MRQETQILSGDVFRENLGGGSVGSVYLEVIDGVKYAVKQITNEKIRTIGKQKFEREIALLKKLEHPNIIKLHKIQKQQNKYKIYTEYCDLSLQKLLLTEAHSLTTKVKVDIAIQLIFAICYLRKMRVVHRDIKPANIVLRKVGQYKYIVKLIDFGESKNFFFGRMSRFCAGSYGYMAPQVKRHINEGYNQLCDLWSLGIVLFQLFSHPHTKVKTSGLIFPFIELAKMHELKDRIFGPLSLSLKIPEVFRIIIRNLLKTDAEQRMEPSEISKLLYKNQQIYQELGFSKGELSQINEILMQCKIFESQLSQNKKIQKMIKHRINCMYKRILTPLLRQLNSLRNVQSDEIMETKIFVCKIFTDIKTMIIQLRDLHNLPEQELRELLPGDELKKTDSQIEQIKNYLIRKQINLKASELHKQSAFRFIRRYIRQDETKITEAIKSLKL